MLFWFLFSCYMFNISEYIYLYILVLQYCIWCHVVWHVCSYHSYYSPVLRDPAAQTTDSIVIVRAPGFPSSATFLLWGCDPMGSTYWYYYMGGGTYWNFMKLTNILCIACCCQWPERHMKPCAQNVMKSNLSVQVVKSTVAAAINILATFEEDNYIVSSKDT